MALRIAFVALAAFTLLSVTGGRVARAEPEAVLRIQCLLVAPLIDANPTDITTATDIQIACRERLPNSAIDALDALADDDGSLEWSDIAALEAASTNLLNASCTQPTMNCAMLVFVFVNDDDVVSLDIPPGLATAENGTSDVVCDTEGPNPGQDEDCAGSHNGGLDHNGDEVVVFHLLNKTGTNGQSFVLGATQESVEVRFGVTLGVPGGALDHDADTVPTATDNCPLVANLDQLNTDNAPLILAGAPNDVTVPTGDGLGDVCDSDDDNDQLDDGIERLLPMHEFPTTPCWYAGGPTDPRDSDTDGDLVADRAECRMGYDPTSPASKPPAIPAGDTDRDGLPDVLEVILGSAPLETDSDDDGIIDGIEVRGYHSSPTNHDTDNDGCWDDTEIASVNADRVVNSLDLQAIAIRFNNTTVAMMDVNKDGNINSLDLVLVARAFDPIPCG